MKKRLFLYTTFIMFVGLLSFFAVSVYTTHINNLNLTKDAVIETTRICAGLYDYKRDVASLVKVGNDTRITIISSEGKVLADSRPLDMTTLENHLSRPEIQAAASDSPMTYIRYSDSLGVNFIYYALKVKSGNSYVFIRTAMPVAKIDTYLFQSLPLLLFLFFIIALLCFLFTLRTINRITKPFESIEKKLRSLLGGEYAPGPVEGSYDEIDEIANEIDEIAQILQSSFTALRDEKHKMEYILNNIQDALFVVDENKNIVLINSAALDIFNIESDIVNKNLNYLPYDKMLAGAVDDCVIYKKNALFELVLNGSIFLVATKRLFDTELTMVVLSDVTENRENAKRREEFFANASHELKTPLTAIKGFNELTALNSKDENVRKYIDGITRETDRMLSLIGDMLKLSELESTQDINPVSISLAKIVNEVCEALSTVISEKSISFEVTGDTEVNAEPGHIYELVKNLVENAVRYNNQGGRVSIRIENRKLLVFDDGIGIPPEEQARIFERFYRVEKSRSQRNGGTGLGLSIVKHTCALYGWKLSLKSKLGAGTEVTVIFES